MVFAKSPYLGHVKTRLQPELPASFSLELHCQLVDYVLQQWSKAAVCPIDVWLAGEPLAFIEKLPQWENLSRHSQQGDDLGQRMHHAVKQTLKTVTGVILVGTDCPFIDRDYLSNACEALKEYDVVIGPALDGGYVLLGLKKPHPALFKNIKWGESSVFEETLEQIKISRLTYAILPSLSDIDRPEDLGSLKQLKCFNNLLSRKR